MRRQHEAWEARREELNYTLGYLEYQHPPNEKTCYRRDHKVAQSLHIIPSFSGLI